MKKTFTLITTGVLCLLLSTASAQYAQNFDNNGTLGGNCWTFAGFFYSTSSADVITGTGSLYTNPPTNNNGSGTRDMTTPFLNIPTPTINIAFNYKLSSTLSGQAARSIEIGLLDVNDVFTSLDRITMNRNTPNLTLTNSYNKTFATTATSIQRIVLKFSGTTGDGNTRMIVDDFYTDASPHYSLNGTNCNTAPTIQNDIYNAMAYTAYAGTSVLLNDGAEPDGENTSLNLVTLSPDGKVTFNEDGSFLFTPNDGFTGTSTTFTYSLTDNGYKPLTATATVTINFSQAIVLPIKLISFRGHVIDTKVQLEWLVVANETGSHFEIEKSIDGKSFRATTIMFTTPTAGEENYQYADPAELSQTTYYRIKTVNKDNSISYSNIISLKKEVASLDSKLTLLQNPVQSTLSFTLSSSLNEKAEVAVYNLAGVRVYSQTVTLRKGANSISFDVDTRMVKGAYILTVQSSNGISSTKFIKQ